EDLQEYFKIKRNTSEILSLQKQFHIVILFHGQVTNKQLQKDLQTQSKQQDSKINNKNFFCIVHLKPLTTSQKITRLDQIDLAQSTVPLYMMGEKWLLRATTVPFLPKHDNKHAWVYEYMENGSLHDHLHKLQSTVIWPARIKMALDAAKGTIDTCMQYHQSYTAISNHLKYY
ncbi:putative serine/threonine-protein kinase pbl28, partial [Quercus suber]